MFGGQVMTSMTPTRESATDNKLIRSYSRVSRLQAFVDRVSYLF